MEFNGTERLLWGKRVYQQPKWQSDYWKTIPTNPTSDREMIYKPSKYNKILDIHTRNTQFKVSHSLKDRLFPHV